MPNIRGSEKMVLSPFIIIQLQAHTFWSGITGCHSWFSNYQSDWQKCTHSRIQVLCLLIVCWWSERKTRRRLEHHDHTTRNIYIYVHIYIYIYICKTRRNNCPHDCLLCTQNYKWLASHLDFFYMMEFMFELKYYISSLDAWSPTI